MESSEYTEKLNKLNEAHKASVEELKIRYAESHRLFNIGDIVTDGNTYLRIDKFEYYVPFLSVEPSTCYYGMRVCKSNLKPFKRGDVGVLYQEWGLRKCSI